MFRSISSALVVCALMSHPAAAQSGRVEAWGGATLVVASLDARVTTQYVPLIQDYSAPLAGSTAGQIVQVQAGNTVGFGAGLNLFFSPHVGFQFLFDSDSRDVSGTNGNYTVLLNYTARQPPDYVERSYSSASTFTPCDTTQSGGCVLPTTGTLEQRTLGFNIVGRWKAGPRVNGELSGGLTYSHVRGDAASLRYSSFRMGGHSVLFSQEYQLAYSIGPAHGYGFDAGGTVDIEISKAVAFTIDGRYFAAAGIAAPLTVTDVTNKDTIVFLQDVGTIQQNLHPPDAEISPSRFRVLLGLKIRG